MDADVSIEEAITLGAQDGVFFNHFFFPRAFRQESPPMHYDIVQRLEYQGNRYVGLEIPRDFAKTTLLRGYVGKRIGYAISRTILFVGLEAEAAIRSVKWIKKQVEFNSRYSQAFGLQKGSKWADDHCEIIHLVETKRAREAGEIDSTDFVRIVVLAVGIYGPTRGINIDEWRPDLIIPDDICNEINTNTPEQLEKTAKILFGAVQNSLAPASEAPHAKLCLLQTGFNEDDVIHIAHRDPTWETVKYSVFDFRGESTWPQRYPTAVLEADKRAYVQRGQLSIWLREKESTIISDETCAFKEEWLMYWETLPEYLTVYIGLDPASSEAKTADYNAIVVVGFYRGMAYLLDYAEIRTSDPEEVLTEFFRLRSKWKPMAVSVETIGYQRTLASLMMKEMRRLGQFTRIIENQDRRKKPDRIRQAITGRASHGAFWVHKSHADWIVQYTKYPAVPHDDLLDATAMALDAPGAGYFEGDTYEADYIVREKDLPMLEHFRGAP